MRRGAADHGVRVTHPDNDAIAAAFRDEASQATATLIRLLGDIDLAEEAVQDAFVAALEHWHRDGIPDRPGVPRRSPVNESSVTPSGSEPSTTAQWYDGMPPSARNVAV